MKAGAARRWTWLRAAGFLATLIGSVDPMEGSIVILAGTVMVLIGTVRGGFERSVVRYRQLVLVLVATGVGSMWGLTAFGGVGGPDGLSGWWGLLLLPGLVGWSFHWWGADSPRWVLSAGIAAGVWFLALSAIALSRPLEPPALASIIAAAALCITGVATVWGCAARVFRAITRRPETC